MPSKEIKELIRAAKKQGWRVEMTKKGHVIFYAPDGVNKATSAGTPGRGRGTNNLIARLRKYGFEWKGR